FLSHFLQPRVHAARVVGGLDDFRHQRDVTLRQRGERAEGAGQQRASQNAPHSSPPLGRGGAGTSGTEASAPRLRLGRSGWSTNQMMASPPSVFSSTGAMWEDSSVETSCTEG